MLFINVDEPRCPGTSAARRAVRSQAARSGHAKIRRQRMCEYQGRTMPQLPDGTFNHPSMYGEVPEYGGLINTVLPSRGDDFDACCRALSSLEHRLFDHCKHMPISLLNDVYMLIHFCASRHSDSCTFRDPALPTVHRSRIIQAQHRHAVGSYGHCRYGHVERYFFVCLPQSSYPDEGSLLLRARALLQIGMSSAAAGSPIFSCNDSNYDGCHHTESPAAGVR